MKTMFLLVISSLFLILASGCASSKAMTVTTHPSGAMVKIIDGNGRIKSGITPITFQLSPKEIYNVNLTKPGYEPIELTGSAYVQEALTMKNLASTATAFIIPPVGISWIALRAYTGDYKSFDKIDVQFEPLQTPIQNKEVLKTQNIKRETETEIEIEIEIPISRR